MPRLDPEDTPEEFLPLLEPVEGDAQNPEEDPAFYESDEERRRADREEDLFGEEADDEAESRRWESQSESDYLSDGERDPALLSDDGEYGPVDGSESQRDQ